MTTLLIADDHPLFREALRGAVQRVMPGVELFEADNVGTGFGAFQVMAGSNTQPTTEACSAWQCAAECPKFGGQFGQGNVCYCCG